MIQLPNGDLWIYDDEEIEPFSERGDYKFVSSWSFRPFDLLSRQSPQEFCDKAFYGQHRYFPRKWTDSYGGYWDCNYSIFEVFRELSISYVITEWYSAAEMPWGHVYVVFHGCSECDTDFISRFDSVEHYNESVRLKLNHNQ